MKAIGIALLTPLVAVFEIGSIILSVVFLFLMYIGPIIAIYIIIKKLMTHHAELKAKYRDQDKES